MPAFRKAFETFHMLHAVIKHQDMRGGRMFACPNHTLKSIMNMAPKISPAGPMLSDENPPSALVSLVPFTKDSFARRSASRILAP